jgi:hypothetical protein
MSTTEIPARPAEPHDAPPLLEIGDPAYEDARRVWNGVIDRRPPLIVPCASPEEVADAMRLARDRGLPVTVRGGGHNVAGTAVSDEALLIDLAPMRKVTVDPDRRIVRVGGGARWSDVDRSTQRFGLATPGGVVSQTGVGGLTLGGGVGWLRRKHGLSSDNLVGAELVTPQGRIVHTDEDPELLWGLRGGGGGFGAVTSFEFRLHPVGPELMMALTFYPGESTRAVLHGYDELCAASPDEVSAVASVATVPAEDPFPEDAHGRPCVVIAACHLGTVEAGERELRPFRELDQALIDLSEPMEYLDVQSAFDADYPDGLRYYWKSTFVDDFGPEAIERIEAHGAARPSASSTIDVWQLGGAVARASGDATAFRRDARYLLGIEANWDDPAADARNIGWVRTCVADLERFGGGRYRNFPGFYEEGESPERRSLGPAFGRLRKLRKRYDPEGRLAS